MKIGKAPKERKIINKIMKNCEGNNNEEGKKGRGEEKRREEKRRGKMKIKWMKGRE